ncbi:MAG: hypothetical protein N0E58_10215 [Candidatus Thiodiazotropha endolucinida]|uniref:Uncharacterized protein n=1 Tax=Candidatus Thiodiazotropha taylori TaxID=2792791 RepID=A0A9E4NJI5_9GAMM|nr:hypothetical protein [Candidatus Thiodiazotropha sp. (ex Lucina pensylvanica)]MBT3053185.1 hypothetical protein [Candidatus Thiodiazotropha sp. (ex Codakia orbicularis)]MBT3054336.1 hypothetical protein [Candidatus Thiodiazotropha sp. (ex Codakia orbicularis)]MCG7978484.1 hypothetical protein [Candidatus Thiodiazotropha taylori]MCW4236617.1 hypothetical protein [Candidatus Thiodiazotropha endolucinida]
MKNLPTVAKVLITLAVVLFSAEALLRSIEGSLSGNISHVIEIPELSERFDQSDEPGLLVLGNSLTNNGIDATLLKSGLEAQGLAYPTVEKMVPDATTIWSWSCILRNRIYDLKNKPNTVFIGFAWNQLADQSRLLPTQLGGFFCSYSDLMHFTEQTEMGSAEIGEFLTASTFRLFTHREAFRNKMLGILIPHYMSATQEINRRMRNAGNSAGDPDLTYRELSQVIEKMESYNKHVVLMAMPVRDNTYELDPELINLVKSEGVTLLDYRSPVFITDNLFLDEMHLNENGSALLTQQLVVDFAKVRSTLPQ